ncbi:MAG: hypothetical protein B6D58_01375 [candidate division Zixibacteria bacterium 4484_95]|nr:MAG: hypothetical protein B6D58_01375 [candidate division Zixibacteria bacterium 4484_95]
MKLAKNSFKVERYSRAADNCRLAVEIALRQNNRLQAAEAFDLWIRSVIKKKKYSEVKKICCEARSKLGNHLDLLYYEAKVAFSSGDYKVFTRLAKEYIELRKKTKVKSSTILNKSYERIDEIKDLLNKVEKKMVERQTEVKKKT